MERENRVKTLFMFWIVTALFCSGGCGATVLTDAGRSVQLMKADPSTGCKELGSVSGEATGAGAHMDESAKNEMRNKAAAMGANYVRLETASHDGTTLTGTAYACPNSAAPEPAPAK